MAADEPSLRAATLADLPAIAAIYDEAVRTSTATFDTEPRSPERWRTWFERHGERYPLLVAVEGKAVIGYACLAPWSPRPAYAETAESACYVRADRRGHGVGRRLKQALIARARELGFHTLLARVAEGSDASLHLNEELGFRRVGTMREVGRKFGRRLDVHLLQLLL